MAESSEDSVLCFYFSVPVNKSVYDRGIPPDLTLNIWTGGATLKDWEVCFCRVRDMSKGGANGQKLVDRIPYPAPNAPGFYGVDLLSLPSDGDLRLDIYLKRIRKSDEVETIDAEGIEAVRESLSKEIFFNRNLQIIDRPLP